MNPIAVLGTPKFGVCDSTCHDLSCCWQVDVLFEEERGFWSAVYELIATTKRPIIMTCNGEWKGEGQE